MDLRQLRYFISVFEHGSISRAAADIPISQSALTRSIHILEDELGVKLFQREARGVIPTSAGERLYRHAYKILAACDRAEEDVRSADDYLSGEVVVGVAALFSHSVMDRVAKEFYQKYPKVTLVVSQGLPGDLLSGLERGDFEQALCHFPLQALSETHNLEALMELSSYVYVNSQHPLANANTVSWKSLAEASWVSFNHSETKAAFDALFLNQNLAPPKSQVLTNSLSLLKSMIFKRGFVGILPQQLMEDETAAGMVTRIALRGTPIKRRAGLITLRGAKRSPLSELLADDIRAVCSELNKAPPYRE